MGHWGWHSESDRIFDREHNGWEKGVRRERKRGKGGKGGKRGKRGKAKKGKKGNGEWGMGRRKRKEERGKTNKGLVSKSFGAIKKVQNKQVVVFVTESNSTISNK